MTTYHVLVLSDFQEVHKESMPKSLTYTYIQKDRLTKEMLAQADIVIGNPPINILHEAKKLKLLQLETAGNEAYTQEGILPQGCILCNATGSFGLAISEYLLCTTLMLMRNMNHYVRNQEKALWQVEGPITSIYGATFLIIGMGDLGSEFAKKVKLLGGYTIGIKKHINKKIDYVDELYTLADMETVIPRADVVVMALPSTAETWHCFKKSYFAKMKERAFFINVGRGTAIVTEDLLDAVQQKSIAGAAIDVCDIEPIPKDHPIWKEENIMITPHISGTFQLPETFERFVKIVAFNVQAFIDGEELQNVVDRKEGYRIYK